MHKTTATNNNYLPWVWNNGYLEDTRGALRVDVNPYSDKVEGGASDEDKDYLLKAVNNHEALLEAVKLALHVHIDYVRESGDDSQEANEYQAKLEQAIINATQTR